MKYANVKATIRSNGNGGFYISFDNGTRRATDYKTVAGAERVARTLGCTDVTIDPGANASLVSVAHLCSFVQIASGQMLRIELDKYSPEKPEEYIEFRGSDAIKTANEFLPKMGFKPVRVTYNMLNRSAGPIVIDADTPSYCDVGSEAYHSM